MKSQKELLEVDLHALLATKKFHHEYPPLTFTTQVVEIALVTACRASRIKVLLEGDNFVKVPSFNVKANILSTHHPTIIIKMVVYLFVCTYIYIYFPPVTFRGGGAAAAATDRADPVHGRHRRRSRRRKGQQHQQALNEKEPARTVEAH